MPKMPLQVPLIVAVIIAVFRDRADLIAENVALRHQLSCLKQRRKRPKLRPLDRALWAVEAIRTGQGEGEVWISESPRSRLSALLDELASLQELPAWAERQLQRALKHGGDIGVQAYSLMTRAAG